MVNLNKCMGCGACESVCEVDAISMVYDEKGFLTKKIDTEKCIYCNKCDEVCILSNEVQAPYSMQYAYLFVNKDIYDRNVSSSGGFVKALADYVFERGGICFGACIEDDFSIRHIEIDKKDEIYAILGSKYVQSRTDKTFVKVKEVLEQNRLVLYTGTPCQIAGLKHFLNNKEYVNLITVDIFCHGIPPQKLWLDYLSEYFGNEEIRYIQFRDKTQGWWQYRFRIQFSHDEYASYYRPPGDDFIRLFLDDTTINDACLECPYRTREKYSDFYIGDAWNINKIKKNMDDNRGVTTVISNSYKAEEILEELRKKHHLFPVSLEEGVYSREELFGKKEAPVERNDFWKIYREKGIRAAIDEMSR